MFNIKNNQITDIEFLEKEIQNWKNSRERQMQIKGYKYYLGEHDIINRKRSAIGENGELEEITNIPNNKIIDNQYTKLVNQKANYLFGKPITIEDDNKTYVNLLNKYFNKRFMRTMKNLAKAAINNGIAWLFPFYSSNGLSFRIFPGYEILPFWFDNEHTQLEFAIRLYLTSGYEGNKSVEMENVEIYTTKGIYKYILKDGKLIPDYDSNGENQYFYVTVSDDKNAYTLNWQHIPLIAFKANESEIPLIKRIKSLQDGLNELLSDFQNNMQEDCRNTILVLKNYDGTNLGEFRKNLATYGAVKVRYDGETKGGVETLEISVNSENYKAIIDIFKKAIIENGMGYDAKNDKLGTAPNEMNIQSMYSDIDLDANDMETEFQAAFEELLWFINVYFANSGKGDFFDETITVIFNRDMMMNEGEIINNCRNSVGILSDETIIGQHPWVDDPQLEMNRLKKQKKTEQEYNPFNDTSPLSNNGDE